ncbi:hypothetical protein ColKHC_00916 [Colletotrichum higginsianum]|nr:hypothetical protein ColKHC_00916 [Colletotrichum higginsianum]
MQRFNGPRQFSLMGKGSRSVSRQSLVSIDSGSEQRSLTDSEASPSPASDDAVVQVEEVASESEADPESAPARSPALPDANVEPATVEPVLEGWLEYCCVPVGAEEQAAELEPEPALKAEVPQNTQSTPEEPAIVITPAEIRPRPITPPRSFEGFLEYAIETIVEEEEGEEDSDAEFHDADSTFATATEMGLNSPTNFEQGAPSPLILDSATPSPNLLDSASPCFDNLAKRESGRVVEDAASAHECQSVSSGVSRTPTSDSAISFSDKDDEETRELTPEPVVPFSEHSVRDTDEADTAAIHDDMTPSMSLSHWSPRASFFLPDEASDSYFSHMRKLSIPRPLFSRPDSGVTPLGRSPFSHKRQFSSPTAGLFGLHEPRRLDIGLRGALLGFAALQKQGRLERRPSQVLLRLENDRGMVIVPGGSRRNSETRGIGGAGFLGLGNVYAL